MAYRLYNNSIFHCPVQNNLIPWDGNKYLKQDYSSQSHFKVNSSTYRPRGALYEENRLSISINIP